ncbi:uncharacterized protein TNCV_2199501 [Trichonephila clavipes]|nr:uncharacterized protein TNCV_2199501 [Trichonephila clavipes]
MEFPYMKTPFYMLICGPSNSGETYFVKRLLDTKLIKPIPSKIIWCYGAYQELFNEILDVEFHEGIPHDIENTRDVLIIIDDLMSELGDERER